MSVYPARLHLGRCFAKKSLKWRLKYYLYLGNWLWLVKMSFCPCFIWSIFFFSSPPFFHRFLPPNVDDWLFLPRMHRASMYTRIFSALTSTLLLCIETLTFLLLLFNKHHIHLIITYDALYYISFSFTEVIISLPLEKPEFFIRCCIKYYLLYFEKSIFHIVRFNSLLIGNDHARTNTSKVDISAHCETYSIEVCSHSIQHDVYVTNECLFECFSCTMQRKLYSKCHTISPYVRNEWGFVGERLVFFIPSLSLLRAMWPAVHVLRLHILWKACVSMLDRAFDVFYVDVRWWKAWRTTFIKSQSLNSKITFSHLQVLYEQYLYFCTVLWWTNAYIHVFKCFTIL